MAIGAKNEPTKVPGKGLSSGGKVQGLQHMHMRADEMASHDSGMAGETRPGAWPASPVHAGGLMSKDEAPAGDANMHPGLGPIEVPGKGL
jgi:hypothetical protein